MEIETTIGDLADEYGVAVPAGCDGFEQVTLSRGDDGAWHVGGALAGLQDDEWAPRDDTQAAVLARRLR